MTSFVAAINAGSSSIKFAIYGIASDPKKTFGGQISGIGVMPRLKVTDANGAVVAEQQWPSHDLDHTGATHTILETARGLIAGGRIEGVGHRVVHGGPEYNSPQRVDAQLLDKLATLIPLAPLHQPHNLAPIRTILAAAPHIPQVVCFDTAFHRSQPSLAQWFAIPRKYTAAGVCRYGFHGISYEFLTAALRENYPHLASGRVVMAHLGNGASLCAVKDGRSIASTMGFTAVEGLMMGTRCGSLDPGVILYLMSEYGETPQTIEDLIYNRSGLLGVSGISSDMRTLRSSRESAAREAIDLFVYRIVREIGSMAAAAGGMDALVFAGGIGENDPVTRADVVQGCAWLGAMIDPERNARGNGLISAADSRTPVLVIETSEELMIARHTLAMLGRPGRL
ncbi:MAG TPA: acetate/propionate family kinase [Acetobacteraceae bacterium]|nr:acetate/propionate family kinase [Acetobacteraceae bacterium]